MYSFSKKEKVFIPFFCAFGIFAVGYGMVIENNLVFLAGLIFVVVGYLCIRRRLKASVMDSGAGHHRKKPTSPGS